MRETWVHGPFSEAQVEDLEERTKACNQGTDAQDNMPWETEFDALKQHQSAI